MLYAARGMQASNDSACWPFEDGKIWVLAYLLVLLELDVHIPCHFGKLGRAIALPEEVAITYLQCQHLINELGPPKNQRVEHVL